MSTVPPLPPPLPIVPVTTPLPDTGAQSQVSFPWLNFFQQLQAMVNKLNQGSGGPAAGVQVLYVASAPAVANGFTTANQLLISCTVPGGSLNAAGKVLRCTMGGEWTIQTGETPNMGVFVNLENLQLFGISASGMVPNQPDMAWRAVWEAVVQTPGTSGQLVRHGQFLSRYTDAGGNETMFPLIDINTQPQGPIDLTSNQTLQSGCYFTTQPPTLPINTLTLDVFIVEILN